MINVQYSDNSMIENHLKPYEKQFQDDGLLNNNVLKWIAKLHKVDEQKICFADGNSDQDDILMVSGDTFKIGEVNFY